MTDPITDMLNQIKNAQAVSHKTVSVPFSNLKYEIALILEKHGFIEKLERKGRNPKRSIEITLKHPAAISGLKRISKPGQRIYTGFKYIKGSKGGLGILIISTPKGLMTDKEARKNKLGGEVICEIW
ncbi:MAG: 30S ribosomal protein S8 [bacterium]|nr:30S ribosomal protein S8 [bacterium]